MFSPEQIRSATDNIGTFDENNPEIYYSMDESSSYAKNSEEDEARVAYFEDMGAQRKQQYVEGIRVVYEAKRAYEEAVKPVAEYKRLVHAQLRSKADGFLDTASSWKDKKSGLAYSPMR